MKHFYAWALTLALLSGTNPVGAEETRQGRVHHVVIVWLKEPGSQAVRSRYQEITRSLAKLPGVLSYSVGSALPSTHERVDSSYDLAVEAVFKDAKALEDYNANPLHQQAVAAMRPLVQKLVVYDFAE